MKYLFKVSAPLGGKIVKTYTTGQVAIMLREVKDGRTVANLAASGKIRAELISSRLGRKSTWKIRLGDIPDFMQKHHIVLSGKGDIEPQKWVLAQNIKAIRERLKEEGKPGGVFSGFPGIVKALLAVIANLDPLDDLNGASEDRMRADMFRQVAAVIESHTNLRHKLAASRKSA